MELLIVLVMILLGGGIAAAVAITAAAFARAENQRAAAGVRPTQDRDSIAASIIYQIGAMGGNEPARVLAYLHEQAHLAAPVTRNVDIPNWAEMYRHMSTQAQREELLDASVRAAVALNSALPLGQYNALMELSFALGFQTDALARLRAKYRFEYTDYAKAGRPREADRAGGATALFDRESRSVDPEPLLKVLGLSGNVSRHDLTSTYRKLAAQHHPDRFHNATLAQQQEAAARFIAVTEAFERLLPLYGQDANARED